MDLPPEELNEIVNFEKMSQMDMALEHMKQEYFTQLTIRNMSGMFMNTRSRSTSHNSRSGTRQVSS